MLENSRLLLLLLLGVMLSGCGLARSDYVTYNFVKDKTMAAFVGSPMIQIVTERKNDVYMTGLERTMEEWDYIGKEGTVIQIYYKELSEGYARRAFTQELTFDLDGNDIITYRRTKIKVVEATPSKIRFIVLDSPVYGYASGAGIP